MNRQDSMVSESSIALSDASAFSTASMVEALAKIPGPKVECNVEMLVPKQMAQKLEAVGIKKGKELDLISMFILAMHAGIFVSFGAGFFTVVHSGVLAHWDSHFGLIKFAGGLAFCTGLAMVILCGSELFTGNAFLIMAWSCKKITTYQMFRNWTIVWIGNFVGSLIIAALQLWGRTYENCSGQVGRQALDIAYAKLTRNWGQCYCLGILCNIMVCWSVWMTVAGRTGTDKLVVFILPITAFAAMGFEHSVANMYFLPYALMVLNYAPATFWDAVNKTTAGVPASQYVTKHKYEYDLTIGKMIWRNLIPATIGNSTGAIVFIALIYWYLYLRDKEHVSRFQLQLGSFYLLASPPPEAPKKVKKPKTTA